MKILDLVKIDNFEYIGNNQYKHKNTYWLYDPEIEILVPAWLKPCWAREINKMMKV